MKAPPSAVSRGGPSRASSAMTMFNDDGQVDTVLFQRTTAHKVKGALKLILVASPSFVVAAVLTFFNLSNVLRSYEEGEMVELRRGLEDATAYNDLQSNMAVERGLTCVALNSIQSQQDDTGVDELMKPLRDRRMTVNDLLDDIDTWHGTEVYGPEFVSLKAFAKSIREHRAKIDAQLSKIKSPNSDVDPLAICGETLDFYTRKIDVLIQLALSSFHRLDSGRFWLSLEGLHAWLSFRNFLEVETWSGAMALDTGNFQTPEALYSFIERKGAAEYSMFIADEQVEGLDKLVNEMQDEAAMDLADLVEMRVRILESNETTAADPVSGQQWRREMTLFSLRLSPGDEHVWAQLTGYLDALLATPEANLRNSIILAVLILIIIPPFIAWYMYSGNKNMEMVQAFMLKQRESGAQITAEKQRTEDLLNQMLPPSVGKILRGGGTVDPEKFECVTVFFADIHGFSNLSSYSTPFQIIELLNSLYSTWDAILDLYDVYKVETIADSYVVASGLPVRNGDQHSSEICTMALHFLQIMEDFTVPHLPGHQLLVRIGCNTGPVATGVVGTKMPRFCLFGDTINTCARVQTSSRALQIQITSKCKEHLDKCHPDKFNSKLRGKMALKGKGEVETHWLLGKQGFVYTVDTEVAERRLKDSIYSKD